MLTFIATVFGFFLLIGGALNVLCNLKSFEEILKGIGTIFGGLIVLLLCMGWETKVRNQFLISHFLIIWNIKKNIKNIFYH